MSILLTETSQRLTIWQSRFKQSKILDCCFNAFHIPQIDLNNIFSSMSGYYINDNTAISIKINLGGKTFKNFRPDPELYYDGQKNIPKLVITKFMNRKNARKGI